MFEDLHLSTIVHEGKIYIDAEQLVAHLKWASWNAMKELGNTHSDMQDKTFFLSAGLVEGLVGVGMWLEQGVIEDTQEKFAEWLDNPWPID